MGGTVKGLRNTNTTAFCPTQSRVHHSLHLEASRGNFSVVMEAGLSTCRKAIIALHSSLTRTILYGGSSGKPPSIQLVSNALAFINDWPLRDHAFCSFRKFTLGTVQPTERSSRRYQNTYSKSRGTRDSAVRLRHVEPARVPLRHAAPSPPQIPGSLYRLAEELSRRPSDFLSGHVYQDGKLGHRGDFTH